MKLTSFKNFVQNKTAGWEFFFKCNIPASSSISLPSTQKWSAFPDCLLPWRYKLQHFSNDAFQSYYDLFQVN